MSEFQNLISERELCDWLGLTLNTVRRIARENRDGFPSPIKLNTQAVVGTVRYDRDAVTAWLKSRPVVTTKKRA